MGGREKLIKVTSLFNCEGGLTLKVEIGYEKEARLRMKKK
jgi:hypothetical protein